MSASHERSLDMLATEALREEYLDLLLLAGRLARQNAEKQPKGSPPEAAAARSFILTHISKARARLKLGRFSGAPEAVVEAELAIVAFLDWVAISRYELQNWQSLREDYYRDYVDAGRDDASVSDLGKYLYGKLEELRHNGEKLQRTSLELITVYSCCLRLGYLASYDERPNELSDLRKKLDAALRRGSVDKLAYRPPATTAVDPRLTPDLPSLADGAAPPIVLNPLWIAGLALALLVVMGVGLRLVLFQKERNTLQALDRSREEIQRLAFDTEDICREPAVPSLNSVAEASGRPPGLPRRILTHRRGRR